MALAVTSVISFREDRSWNLYGFIGQPNPDNTFHSSSAPWPSEKTKFWSAVREVRSEAIGVMEPLQVLPWHEAPTHLNVQETTEGQR